jgi:glycosyltransferase domain-containing protein
VKANLTIVIPTKNRHQYVKEQINFYKKKKFTGVLLYLDSSDACHSYSGDESVGLIVKHIRAFGLPHQVIKNNLELIETEFCVFSGDDDYFYPETAFEVVKFLSKNPDFTGASSSSYIFSVEKSGNFWGLNQYPMLESHFDLAQDRLLAMLNNYAVPFFSIVRSKTFKDSFSQIYDDDSEVKIPRVFNDELLASCLMVLSGKFSKQSLGLYLVRLDHEDRNSLDGHSVTELEINNFSEIVCQHIKSDKLKIDPHFRLQINHCLKKFFQLEKSDSGPHYSKYFLEMTKKILAKIAPKLFFKYLLFRLNKNNDFTYGKKLNIQLSDVFKALT